MAALLSRPLHRASWDTNEPRCAVVAKLLASSLVVALLIAGTWTPAHGQGGGPEPAALESNARPARQRFLQRVWPFENTGISLQVGICLGPPATTYTSELGLSLPPRSSEKPQGVFWQNGAFVGPFGGRHLASPQRELRGWEYKLGPIGRKHPLLGDRMGVPIIPGMLTVFAAREGGLGIGVSLPIPGLPYLLCRMPVTIFVSHPKLCRVATAVNDALDRAARSGARLVEPLRRRIAPPAERIARRVADSRLGRLARRLVSKR